MELFSQETIQEDIKTEDATTPDSTAAPVAEESIFLRLEGLVQENAVKMYLFILMKQLNISTYGTIQRVYENCARCAIK